MSALLRRIVNAVPSLRRFRHRVRRRKQHRAELAEWNRTGRPDPPPHLFKIAVLREYAQRFKLEVLVETGTFYGDTVDAMRRHLSHVYSIELSPELHAAASVLFANAANVTLICGDSAVELARLVPQLHQPTLFWLDGHYSAGVTAKGSKETPIMDELPPVLDRRGYHDVILIDDARCFGRDADYPTLQALEAFVHERRPDLAFAVEHDIIRISPGRI